MVESAPPGEVSWPLRMQETARQVERHRFRWRLLARSDGALVRSPFFVKMQQRLLLRKRPAHPPLGAPDQAGFLSGNNSSMRLFGQEGSFSRVSISQAMGSIPFARAVSRSD